MKKAAYAAFSIIKQFHTSIHQKNKAALESDLQRYEIWEN